MMPATKTLPAPVQNALEAALVQATRDASAARNSKIVKYRDANWKTFLALLFPSYITFGFAKHHAEFWDWVWSIQGGVRPQPFVGIWARGGGKSSSAELATVALAARGIRHYALYVSETQEQADKHIVTISSIMESIGINRAVNKYGASKGWRRNRLRTADGFTVDSLGMDTAARGIKVEKFRPDIIVLDDIDGRHDTDKTIQKKRETITTTILPSGNPDCAVLAIQNLIHGNSLFSELYDGRADWLSDRIVSGAHPALLNMTYETVDGVTTITGGTPTWEGQSVAVCQGFVNSWGIRSFLRECQHITEDAEGALWKREWIEHNRVANVPCELIRVVVGVDPSATSGERSAEAGVIVAGIGSDGHGYILDDLSLRATPRGWAMAAVEAYKEHNADRIVGETNNGGEMVELTIRSLRDENDKPLAANIPFTAVHASRGKAIRAEPVSALYEQGMVHHVGSFPQLEDQQCNWIPGDKSPDRLDALVWAVTALNLAKQNNSATLVPASNNQSRWHTGGYTGSRWRRR